MINFYCVTLENNIENIEKCILKLKKIYKNKFSYTIITPKKSLKAFSEIESKYNCKIIDENQIISKSDFRYLVYSIKERIIKEENSNGNNGCAGNGFNCVMFHSLDPKRCLVFCEKIKFIVAVSTLHNHRWL